jgi:hypothetical protein
MEAIVKLSEGDDDGTLVQGREAVPVAWWKQDLE